MTDHKLSRDNAAVVLVDFLAGFLPGVKTIPHTLLEKNAEAFARVSEIFGLPTILLGDEGGFRGNFFPGVVAHAGHATRIERSAVSAWDVPQFREEIERFGRRKIVLGGISIDICTSELALDLLAAGYEVYVVVDVSGSDSALNEQAAMMRLTQAGAVMINWAAVASELMRDWASAEGPAVGELYQELSAWGNKV